MSRESSPYRDGDARGNYNKGFNKLRLKNEDEDPHRRYRRAMVEFGMDPDMGHEFDPVLDENDDFVFGYTAPPPSPVGEAAGRSKASSAAGSSAGGGRSTASLSVQPAVKKGRKEGKRERKRSGERAGNFTCGKCGNMYSSRSSLKRHKQAMHNGKQSCAQCGEKFPDRFSLERHKRVRHEGPVCRYCLVGFTRRDNMEAHVRKYHGGSSK